MKASYITVIISIIPFSACATAMAADCPAAPIMPRDLYAAPLYSDENKDEPSESAAYFNKTNLKEIDNVIGKLLWMADQALLGSESYRECTIQWLYSLASENALNGKMKSRQASYERKWRISAISFAWLYVERQSSLRKKIVINHWLTNIAESILKEEMEDKADNNQLYWAGLVALNVGLASDKKYLWNQAKGIFEEAMKAIDVNGFLPAEISRGKRALHYHNFALGPLTMMAEVAARHGENWYAFDNGRFHQLAHSVAAANNNPAPMATAAGSAQDAPDNFTLAWLTVYGRRFEVDRNIRLFHNENNPWLGGDLNIMMDYWKDIP